MERGATKKWARPDAASHTRKAGGTLRSSRAVPHPSTNRALRRLTSEFGRDPVHSTRYGRQRQFSCLFTSASFSLPLSRCRARDGPATSQALACVHPSLYLDRPFSHNKVSTAFLPLTAAAFFNHVAPPFIFPVTRSKSIPHIPYIGAPAQLHPTLPAPLRHATAKNCLHFSICACHPCAGAMLIFSVSFQF